MKAIRRPFLPNNESTEYSIPAGSGSLNCLACQPKLQMGVSVNAITEIISVSKIEFKLSLSIHL